MPEVSVSARILSFPNLCCCCGSGRPSTSYDAISTRTSGKKVIRQQSRGWSFPLCTACSRWMQAEKAALMMKAIFIWMLIGGGIGFFGGIGSLPKPVGIILIVLAVGTFAASPFVWQIYTKKRFRANRVKPDSLCDLRPVAYLGWNGSIHTFDFANDDFMDAFIQANRKKVLR